MIRIHGMTRGSTAFKDAIDACVVVVAGDSDSDEVLIQALEVYAEYQRDRSSGLQCQQNTVALHKSAIKLFLQQLNSQSIRSLEEIGKEGGKVDELLAAKRYVISFIRCK